MINNENLCITYYCHQNCTPLKNIMRLPKEEAFDMAYKMAENNKETTAFYRFADFENYYPRRMNADKLLYNSFISHGGNPKTKHPLSFVFQGSEYLKKWFDDGIVIKIPLERIPSEFISFTYGDSIAVLKSEVKLVIMTKEMLLKSISDFDGSIDEFTNEIVKNYYYIEVQLWNDDYSIV